MARVPFRSSRTESRPASSLQRIGGSSLVALGTIAALGYFFLPVFRSESPADLPAHFRAHRADFNALRDRLAAEPSLEAVGVDNVEDFWLFDGHWTASGNRFLAYTRSEMLEAVGLAPARYQAYLDLLGKVHAYRVVRQSARGVPLRGSIFLFPRPSDGGRGDPVMIFSERAPEPLLPLERARRARQTAYARLDDGWYVGFSHR
ncbi:MAG: hypothetical protein IPP35_07430 [Elusimicrobia bacterium]|nr:hypothetical protein [Elusimicrobiota bacterium]